MAAPVRVPPSGHRSRADTASAVRDVTGPVQEPPRPEVATRKPSAIEHELMPESVYISLGHSGHTPYPRDGSADEGMWGAGPIQARPRLSVLQVPGRFAAM